MEVDPHTQPREKPGWMAIALIAAFVLAAVALYVTGAHFVSRAAGDLSSIAVLPFTDTGAEPLGASFAKQLADQLATVAGLHVFTASGIAGERIGSILEGRVRKSENSVQVTTLLIRAADRSVLWSHSYDCETKDVAAVQAEIVRAIVTTLRLHTRGRVAH